MSNLFNECFVKLVEIEGGYANVPGDSGGPTMHGVTQATYDVYRKLRFLPTQDVRKITSKEERDLYKFMFWNEVKGDDLPPAVAWVLFDAAVRSGVKRSILFAQEALWVTRDGILGPQTLKAIKQADPLTLAKKIIELRRHHLFYLSAKPSQQKFRKGWFNRMTTVEKFMIDIYNRWHGNSTTNGNERERTQ